MKYIKHILALGLGITTLVTPTASAQRSKASNKQSFAKALDIMGASMAILERNFVDSVDMDRLSRHGIDAMLQSLDPYTEYYSKEDNDNLKLITTGEYAGIGALISQRPDSTVLISDPMEGMPAALAGLKAGDVILEIDGKDYRRSTSERVSAALKGAPNSKISVLVQRMGEKKPRRIEFVRRKIVINPVPYYGLTPGGYGYIALNSFPNTAAREVSKALKELTEHHQIKGLVLDLRDNGGGLLDEAVKIAALFVPEGSVVVSTKARPDLKQDAVYRTKSKPLYPDLPVVVLIDGGSASSAEIVAGALQDMDRAVVVGRKSFGKGLVQSTVQLPHDGILKLTTAKYYIPSGRCIQRIDYKESRQGRQAKALPDSLTKVFRTASGRAVRDAGGIEPDVEIKADSLPTMLYYLGYHPDTFDWITAYTLKHKHIASPRDFHISDADYTAFGQMLVDKKFDYDRQSAKQLERLKEIAQIEGYLGKVGHLVDSLRTALEPDLKHDLESLRPHIERFLNTSIIGRYYYRRGIIEREIRADKVVSEADQILTDDKRYRSILSSAQQP